MDTSFVGAHLDEYTYQALLAEALAMAPADVDTRQGSIIYDTLAVSDAQLAQGYIVLKDYYINCCALTARGAYLDLRVAEAGVKRYQATAAVKRAAFADATGQPASLPVGTRFSTVSDTMALIYVVSGEYYENGAAVLGNYQMTCEEPGSSGNDYAGELLPVGYLTGVATAKMSDTLIPARDAEADDALLARYLEVINQPAFGGNVAQYRQWVSAIPGVGGVQIYPTADGGGTVKVSVIGANFDIATPSLICAVQTALDPAASHGQGLGLAPMYHFVTVTTPQAVEVEVEATLTLQQGVVIGQVEDSINAAIEAYLLEQRRLFGATNKRNTYAIHIYRARISAAIMSVDGVENVTSVSLCGVDADLSLEQSPQLQQLPLDGVVVLHAV